MRQCSNKVIPISTRWVATTADEYHRYQLWEISLEVTGTGLAFFAVGGLLVSSHARVIT